MRVREQDSNGDMTFGNGQQNFLANSPDAVAQVVQTTLLLILGEWYLNLNDGTPWFQGVLGVHSKDTADQTLITQIKTVDGVTDVQDWTSTIDPVTRKYSSLSAKLITIYGETQLQIDNLENL